MKTLLLCLAALPTLAQQTQPGAPLLPASQIGVTRRVVGADSSPEQLVDEQTKLLTGQLSLSPTQVVQVRSVELARAQEQQALLRQYEALHWSGKIPDEEGQAIEQRFETRLAAICTPTQYQKHQLIQARFRRIRARYDSLEWVRGGHK